MTDWQTVWRTGEFHFIQVMKNYFTILGFRKSKNLGIKKLMQKLNSTFNAPFFKSAFV